MKWLGVVALICTVSLNGSEYLYPVAVDNAAQKAYLIYQKNPYHIELWHCDLKTKYADQLLLSRFTPAGFALLPSAKGFSFIDNGILKVQKFLKRSPRTIEFDAPIVQTELIHWVTDEVCYTSGKYRDHFGIFQIDLDGQVSPICLQQDIDCMYPQKVGSHLFYIERDLAWRYRVCRVPYHSWQGTDFQDRINRYQSSACISHEIISFDKTPIVFLKMVSDTRGYALSHPQQVSRCDREISFDYYAIIKKEAGWHKEKLFSFQIPGDLLLLGSPMRLYESLLPLLPRHQGTTIIYPTVSQNELNLCAYNCITMQTNQLPHSTNLFPPIGHLCGGMIDDRRVALKAADADSIQVKLIEYSL